MEYIIFDLELNSKVSKSNIPNEIIEIGAVKLNENLELIGTFQSFIRPRVFKKLFPIIKRKTSISQSDVNNAPDFKEVSANFRKWLGDDYILFCWGHDDIHNLKLNCEFSHISTTWLNCCVDIQKQFSKIHNMPSGHRYSLTGALELLNIEVVDKLHRADVDAKYTALIFSKIFNLLNLKAFHIMGKNKFSKNQNI